jgi:hypothetical protein
MGKYIISKTSNDGYKFKLLAGNNEIIGVSQVFKSLDSAKKSTESVKRFCDSDIEDQTVQDYEQLKYPKWEIYQDKAGEYRFRLCANNGENILASEGYTAKANAKNGIESIRKNADSEVIVEEE